MRLLLAHIGGGTMNQATDNVMVRASEINSQSQARLKFRFEAFI